jgi:hypothetical protein
MGFLKDLWRRMVWSPSPSAPTRSLSATFATRLYQKLTDHEAGKNLFLSPFSIQVALAMCAAGARGETRRVLAALLDAPENVEEQNRQYAALLQSVYGDGRRPFHLLTANALWGQQDDHFQPAFQEAVADFYDGALHAVNFRAQPDEAARAINAWVSGKTREKIRELIQRDCITPDTRLILTNAIYFKGLWDEPFQEVSTWDENWYGPRPMMPNETHYLGMVVTKRGVSLLADTQVQGRPSVHDLATLLAQVMRRPLAGRTHRPRRLHVRGHPQWRELFLLWTNSASWSPFTGNFRRCSKPTGAACGRCETPTGSAW